MKKIIFISLALCLSAIGQTAFNTRLMNSDGSPYTNNVQLSVYPPSDNAVTIVGTNFVIGGAQTLTFTPTAFGNLTGIIMPGQYLFTMPSNNLSCYLNIPQVSTNIQLFSCAVSVPVVFQSSTLFSFITNSLGYTPAPLNLATNSLNFVTGVNIMTNNAGTVTNIAFVTTNITIKYQKQ